MKISKKVRKQMYADALEARLKGISVLCLLQRRKLQEDSIQRLKEIDRLRASS